MYLQRKTKGYGWYAKVKTKEQGGAEFTDYINFSFKRDCEPTELNEYNSYEGELFFRDSTGKERKVFPIVKYYNDSTHIEFKLLEAEGEEINHGGLGTQYQATLDGREDEEYYKAKSNEMRLNDVDDIDFY